MAPWIVGRRILDLGAGEGYLAAGLDDGERTICGVDVGLFRQAPLPYVVYDGLHLPFADATFDTTLVLLTLTIATSPTACSTRPCASPATA